MAGMTFSRLESVLATVNGIASDKRMPFQARLKNFHKLNFPAGMEQGRGKTYTPGDTLMMALAVELTQLGLPPERIVRLLQSDMYPVFATVQRSVGALRQRDAEPIFLFLDPSALMALTAGDDLQAAMVSWSGARHLANKLASAINNPDHRRLALINVTALIQALIAWLPDADEFVSAAERWARTGAEGYPGRTIIGSWEAA